MNKTILIILGATAIFTLGYFTHSWTAKPAESQKTADHKKSEAPQEKNQETKKEKVPTTDGIKVGAFSISLNVKDLEASRAFYETLGFTTDSDPKANYLIMRNGNALVGIFKGFFQGNMLTFNPGWDENAKPFDPYTDVRELHKKLVDTGYKIEDGAQVEGEGPGYFMVKDPDGNMILFDQHR